MSISTFFCWLAWITVLYYIDPETSGFIGLASFHLSLFLALTGTLSLLGFLIRVLFSKEEVFFRHIRASFRQALLFSILVAGSLILLGMKLFKWWSILLLIIGLTALELFFLSRKISFHRHHYER